MMLAEEVNELWKWPNFLILAGLLGYLIKKHGGPLLAGRSEMIRQALHAGEKAKQEAEVRAAAVQAKLANLDKEISQLRAKAKADLESEAARIRHEAENEMARLEQHTAAEVIAIGKQAQLELRHFAGKLSMDLAEQKIRARMTPDAQSTLLGNFAAQIASQPAPTHDNLQA